MPTFPKDLNYEYFKINILKNINLSSCISFKSHKSLKKTTGSNPPHFPIDQSIHAHIS